MYNVSKTVITKANNKELYEYLYQQSSLSKNLYNAALYRLRQNFTMQGKTELSDNEKEVLTEIEKTVAATGLAKPKLCISYKFLEKLMRVNNNPDFFAGLPMQTAQHIIKQACRDFTSWIKALKSFGKDPSAFLGKPEIPGYKKGTLSLVKFTNQDCVLYGKDNKTYLKFPKTNTTLLMPHVKDTSFLKEVQVKPYYDGFLVIPILESENKISVNEDLIYSCGIDFGVNNLAAIVSNDGSCLLYKGGPIKSANQWYNKQKAKYTSAAEKCNQKKNTHKLNAISKNRDCFIQDHMHKVSSDIIHYCLEHKIGTIVIGVNKDWKQNSNIGKTNNQNFVTIPFATLRWMITYKAKNVGINVIEQEESYTSKASFLDRDFIPTYSKDNDTKYTFSGRRYPRGCYTSKDKTVINSDLNGAANILRKAIPTAFRDITDYSFFQRIETRNFKHFYESKTKRNPVKGVVAA